MKTKLEKPSIELVQKYIHEFDLEEKENPKDSSLDLIFNTFKNNDVFEEIYLKISVLNSFYSTNIYDLNKIAKHILKLNIDERIKAGDTNLVNAIASGHGIASKKSENGKEINFYSFATKYCSWSNKNQYPIYDSFVEKVLMNYKNQIQIDFKNSDLKNYPKFKDIIDSFRESFDLNEFSYKEIDKFLWKFGKENFSE